MLGSWEAIEHRLLDFMFKELNKLCFIISDPEVIMNEPKVGLGPENLFYLILDFSQFATKKL